MLHFLNPLTLIWPIFMIATAAYIMVNPKVENKTMWVLFQFLPPVGQFVFWLLHWREGADSVIGYWATFKSWIGLAEKVVTPTSPSPPASPPSAPNS